MNESKSMVAIAVLVIALGVAWLLNTLNVIPGIDWIWTGGLGIAGILVLMMSGIDTVSVVVGPFLLVTSVLSVLRQTGRLRFDIEMPILAIVFGVLFLFAVILPLPKPHFLDGNEQDKNKPSL
jgi:hypothetical protein